MVDSGGGMHCCWGYEVISFHPSVHKIEGENGGSRGIGFLKDAKGRWVLKVADALEGWNSMAGRPTATRAFRFANGRSIDATPEYCGSMIDMNDLNGLTVEQIERFKHAALLPNEIEEQIASGIESEALQYAFCRKPREALKAFDVWPKRDRAKIRGAFVKSVTEQYPQSADQFDEAAKK